jgi:hypothetical protein
MKSRPKGSSHRRLAARLLNLDMDPYDRRASVSLEKVDIRMVPPFGREHAEGRSLTSSTSCAY